MSNNTISKRIIAVLLSLTLTVTLVPITAAPTTVYAETDKVTLTAGDLDGANGVTIMDVLILLRHIAGKTELTAEQYKAANVNGDTKVDINDLLLMLRYVAGKINSFPNAQGEDEEDPTGEIEREDLEDSDNDGLPDILEDYYGTDKYNSDTDGDVANDYLEILNGTDPLIADMELDYDNDGITNGDEILKHQTDPWNEDTDDDGLTDYEEIFTYKTDPLNPDIDNDGMSDGSEIILGLDPLNPDTDGNGIIDGEEILIQPVELDSMYEFDGLSVVPSIEITGSGDLIHSLYAENIIDNTAVGELPYLVGEPFDFVHDEELEFESSTLRFKLSDDIIAEHNIEDLVISYYDMEEGVVSFVPTEHDGNSVWAEVEHFSPYFVVDSSVYANEDLAYANEEHVYYPEGSARLCVNWRGHKYMIEWLFGWENKMRYVERYCQQRGGYMITINDQEEYEFFKELVVKGDEFAQCAAYWINAKKENGVWTLYNGDPLPYKWWQGDNPENVQGSTNGAQYIYKTQGLGAYICEWDYIPGKTKVLLADGTYIYLNKDPELGDMTVDTDGDGIPDLKELTKKVNISLNPNSRNGYRMAWAFTSNPAKEDTDGDGLLDGRPLYANEKKVVPKDPEPRKFNGSKDINVKEIWQEQYKHELAGNVPSEFGKQEELLRAAYNESLIKLMNVAAGSILKLPTQEGSFPIFNFYYDDKLKALHAINDGAWQEPFGYSNFQDWVFYLATNGNMRKEKFSFYNNNEKYIIWTWYGDYLNLGSGAEIGFYKKKSEFLGLELYVTSDTFPMTLNLYYDYGKNNIKNIFSWAPNRTQWWITGFCPEVEPYAKDMVMLGSVDFIGRESMYEGLKKEMNITGNEKRKTYLIFDEDGHTVWIMWKDSKK